MRSKKSWQRARSFASFRGVGILAALGCGSPSTSAPGIGSSDGGASDSDRTVVGPDGGTTADGARGDSAAPSGDSGASEAGPVPGAPAAPTNFVLTGATLNSISLAWIPSSSSDVSFYNIYRNGTFLARSTTTAKGANGSTIGTFTDSTATNAVSPDYDFPPPTYIYAVSAVDTSSRESTKTTDLSYWMYNTDTSININPTPGNTNPGENGNMNFASAPGVAGPSGKPSIPGNFIQGNYTCAPLSSQIYSDTSGAPSGSPFDFEFSGCGYNQPYSGPPTVPEYALDLGAFNYMKVDFKPTASGQNLTIGVISRLPQGDVFNMASINVDSGKYGPVPTVGSWSSYKIPLADLEVGKGTFVGSISGNILTVESISSGVDVQDGGWVSGGGLSAPVHVDCDGGGENGGCTASLGLTGKGPSGTYEINPPPAKPIESTTFNFQRTNMYKLGIGIGGSTGKYYLNNLGWSVE